MLAVIVLGGLFAVCRLLTLWVSRRALIDSRWRRSAWALTVIGLGALLTEALGLSSVVGAFFAGVGAGEGLNDDVRERCARQLQPLVLMLMPFFFVMIGVQAQWDVLDQSASLWLLITSRRRTNGEAGVSIT